MSRNTEEQARREGMAYANTPCKAPARYKPGIEFGSKFVEVCKKFTKERLSKDED